MIDLDKILNEFFSTIKDEDYENAKTCCLIAIKQALELAANAKYEEDEILDRISDNYFDNDSEKYISNHGSEKQRCREDIMFGFNLAKEQITSLINKVV